MPDCDRLREVPSVHDVLERLPAAMARFPRAVLLGEVRRVLNQVRTELRDQRLHPDGVETRVIRALEQLERPTLRRVINASGVVLHTNLGRAPLGPWEPLPGYSNLEYDLESGRRGQRDVHLRGILERLVGAPGIAVNNNAAAIFLALNELASGGEVVVSRGELIEIGDGFRIPDIMARSGAIVREIGTTNRTSIDDYRTAIHERTRLLLRVHPSNFHISGFTARPDLREIVEVGRERGVPVYEDLGSGCVADLRPFGVQEPLVTESLRAGVDLVSFSGDKLLGGPQAGILAGRPEMVTRLRRNPLFRALRVDKLVYQQLSRTLRNVLLERWDEVPALAMIRTSAANIRARAEQFCGLLEPLDAEIIPGESVIGGGATPEQPIATWLIAIKFSDVVAAEKSLRCGDPPVVARIADERVMIDLRTVARTEEEELAAALRRVPDKCPQQC